jgi:hypothetical protein
MSPDLLQFLERNQQRARQQCLVCERARWSTMGGSLRGNKRFPQDSDLRNRISFERGFGRATDSILDFVAKAAVDIIVMSVRELDPVMAGHLPKSDTGPQLICRAPRPVLTIR